jgi:hypothetical protein
MPNKTVPLSVVEEDHRLEASAARSTEKLAKLRWHNTLDPEGPRYGFTAYARAVGRSDTVIATHAKGYEMTRNSEAGLESLEDAFRLTRLSEEKQEFAKAIAKGSGKPVAAIARGEYSRKLAGDIEHAKMRAEKKGTDPIDEAREAAERHRQWEELKAKEKADAKRMKTVRWMNVENYLYAMRAKAMAALKEAEGVDFTDEHQEFIRDELSKTRAVLDLLDLMVDGNPDIDWDAEMANLTGGES